jgi:NAD(P)H-flavin reductase
VKRDRLTLPIAAIREENDTVRSFTFQTSLPARPGQFVMLTVFSQGEKPFSIMDVTADSFTLTIKKLGVQNPAGKKWMENL